MNSNTVNHEINGARHSGMARVLDWVLVRQQRHHDRAGFAQVHKLEDHMLADIGVTRGQVKWAQGLPASKDPGSELAKEVGRIGVIAPR